MARTISRFNLHRQVVGRPICRDPPQRVCDLRGVGIIRSELAYSRMDLRGLNAEEVHCNMAVVVARS